MIMMTIVTIVQTILIMMELNDCDEPGNFDYVYGLVGLVEYRMFVVFMDPASTGDGDRPPSSGPMSRVTR